MKLLISALIILMFHLGVAAQAIDFDIDAADGAKLRATYYSPGKPGPGILLLHQCNMDRKSWNTLAQALTQRGLHVLTFDYRGYGETKAAGMRENLTTDIDAAFSTLKAKAGVNAKLLAAGGASCGVNNAIQLARRSGEIKGLLFLTGPTTASGLAFLKEHPEIPIFNADEEGFDSGIGTLVQNSKHPASTHHNVGKGWHGVLMFDKDPSLLATMADWVTRVLR